MKTFSAPIESPVGEIYYVIIIENKYFSLRCDFLFTAAKKGSKKYRC